MRLVGLPLLNAESSPCALAPFAPAPPWRVARSHGRRSSPSALRWWSPASCPHRAHACRHVSPSLALSGAVRFAVVTVESEAACALAPERRPHRHFARTCTDCTCTFLQHFCTRLAHGLHFWGGEVAAYEPDDCQRSERLDRDRGGIPRLRLHQAFHPKTNLPQCPQKMSSMPVPLTQLNLFGHPIHEPPIPTYFRRSHQVHYPGESTTPSPRLWHSL